MKNDQKNRHERERRPKRTSFSMGKTNGGQFFRFRTLYVNVNEWAIANPTISTQIQLSSMKEWGKKSEKRLEHNVKMKSGRR